MSEGSVPGDPAPDTGPQPDPAAGQAAAQNQENTRDRQDPWSAAGPRFAPPPGYGQQAGPPPGYGQPPGYAAYGGPPRPAAPKPGIIPLRPLSVGEILDGAFTVIRWNPKATLVPSAVVATISGVLGTTVSYVLEHDVSTGRPSTSNAPVFALFGAIAILSFVAILILTGVLTVVIGQATLGKKETVATAWRTTRSRIWPLIGALLLESLIVGLGWLVAVGISIGAAFLIGAGAHQVPIGVLVGVIGGLAATVFAAIVSIRWSMTIPVVVLERRRPAASLGRSWRLVRGSAWRVFGILLLAELIAGVASLIIRAPFSLLGAAAAGGASTLASSALAAVGAIIGGTLTAPVFAGVVVLLYTDLRMRREGMDLAIQAAADEPAQRQSPW
jgi:hypothetical protein